MTPIDILAAARRNPVGPYLPAREEWLAGWVGPTNFASEADDPPSAYLFGVWLSNVGQIIGERIGYGVGNDRLRLDPRRPEVRDLLVRRGCPAWARELPVAVWCWGMGVQIVKELPPWRQRDPRRQDFERVGANDGRYLHVAAGGQMSGFIMSGYMGSADLKWVPWWRWSLSRFDGHFVTVAEGREDTPELARAAADVAALANAHVLAEADGWYVPLLGGEVGWWPRTTPGGDTPG